MVKTNNKKKEVIIEAEAIIENPTVEETKEINVDSVGPEDDGNQQTISDFHVEIDNNTGNKKFTSKDSFNENGVKFNPLSSCPVEAGRQTQEEADDLAKDNEATVDEVYNPLSSNPSKEGKPKS